MPRTVPQVKQIAGYGLTSQDAARLADFYQRAFGAEIISRDTLTGPEFERAMNVTGGALRYHLQLGDERIDLLQFDAPGQPFSHDRLPFNPAFQHFAIVVKDMTAAMSHLQGLSGWQPLSNGGAQLLPPRSGGVTAFKFQDPDGHPLELLEFPASAADTVWYSRAKRGLFLGVDHSAISVRNSAVSQQFYGTLGFTVTGETYNHGPAQAKLDGVSDPQLIVTALSTAVPTPHLELLCYRADPNRLPESLASNDVAATRTYLMTNDSTGSERERFILDPDGHHLFLVSQLDYPF